MTNQWKPTYQHAARVDVNDACEAFARIEKQHGELTAALVVKDARRKRSKLHGGFEWEDTLAAQKYRETQARHMISAVVVAAVEGSVQTTRVYEHVRIAATDTTPAVCQYIEVEKILAVPAYRDTLLAKAASDARTFKSKYAHLKELAAVIASMDAFVVSVEESEPT